MQPYEFDVIRPELERGQCTREKLQQTANHGGVHSDRSGNSDSPQVDEISSLSENRRKDSAIHLTRLERVTFGSVDRCSIQLSYRCLLANQRAKL